MRVYKKKAAQPTGLGHQEKMDSGKRASGKPCPFRGRGRLFASHFGAVQGEGFEVLDSFRLTPLPPKGKGLSEP
jgi:hypothetical protein